MYVPGLFPFQLSCPAAYHEVKKRAGFRVCLYPTFLLSCPSTTYCKMNRGWFKHISMLFFPWDMSFYLSQSEKRLV